MKSLHQEQINDVELATWDNYRELLHRIFNTPKIQKTRQEKLAYMREWWYKNGKPRRKHGK